MKVSSERGEGLPPRFRKQERLEPLSLTGAIGIVLFFLGAYLLWQSRREVVFWSAEFFRILRGEFSRHREPGEPSVAVRRLPERSRRPGAFRLASGFALLMLGPLQILLDLVLE